jgi:hypothetical protein
MKRERHPDEGRAGLDLLEEATHALRKAPAATLATYYAGSIPFVLGLLYFWADMERNPFAAEHVAEGALGLTLLFFWMKFCQASFAHRLRAQLSAKPVLPWGFRRSVRVFFSQAAIQSTGLFLTPLSLALMIPFGWVYAFYQTATALADPDSTHNWKQVKKAGKQASLWVLQNHAIIGLGFLLCLMVFLNWALVAGFSPYLIKSLFGIETTFSRNPLAMLNTTFFGGVLGLTYLCCDPIMKAVYVLRCFYGESLHSGEDLKADLKHFQMAKPYVALVPLLFVLFAANTAYAQQQVTPGPVTVSELSAEQLDSEIDEVIHHRKYSWRVPRGTVVQEETRQQGILSRFLARVADMARSAINTVARWVRRILRSVSDGEASPGRGLFGSVKPSALLYLLLAAIAMALAVYLFRLRRAGSGTAPPVMATPVERVPDITDESVGADQLPEDRWVALARTLMEQGEFRLAMRAFYLGTLAHLAQRGLVRIARFKSNYDYQRELQRRSHAVPALLALFGENLATFERIWYGTHAVDRELVLQFADNVNRIKTA